MWKQHMYVVDIKNIVFYLISLGRFVQKLIIANSDWLQQSVIISIVKYLKEAFFSGGVIIIH